MLEVNMPHDLKQKLIEWHRQASSGDKPPAPQSAWAEVFKAVFRAVKFDIFPRFKSNRGCEELVTLHLRRLLPFERFRIAFTGEGSGIELTELQAKALAFYRDALEYASTYRSLASGWPSDDSVEAGRKVYMSHHKHWVEIGVPEEVCLLIKRQLQEAPLALFTPTFVPTLNVLAPAYLEWLSTDKGKAFLEDVL